MNKFATNFTHEIVYGAWHETLDEFGAPQTLARELAIQVGDVVKFYNLTGHGVMAWTRPHSVAIKIASIDHTKKGEVCFRSVVGNHAYNMYGDLRAEILYKSRKTETHILPGFVRDDGGRANANFKGKTGDCVVRAISIALEKNLALLSATI